MLPFKRSQRVGQLIKAEVADIILHRIKDPRLGFLTVTDVEVSDDLKHSRVFVSILDEDKVQQTMEILNSAKSFVRSELGSRIRMKFTPTVFFHHDTTARYGSKIESLLRGIKEETH